jgi:hypothetical protein
VPSTPFSPCSLLDPPNLSRWDNVLNGDDVDIVFNNFLNTYLRIYNHAFPFIKCHYNSNNKPWITPGIKISSQRKRELYLLCRSTKDSKLKNYYKRYCRILSDVIKNAKKLYYNNLIISSNNKSKTSWHIINLETNKSKCNHDISSIEIDSKTCNDYLDIAKAFNTYTYDLWQVLHVILYMPLFS